MRKRLLFFTALTALLISCGKKESSANPESGDSDTATFFELCLYQPGNYGSANWRIPALLCLKDGSLLAVCDKRKYNESDLPEDIDIVIRRSVDKGHTWSEPVTIAEGQGVKRGYGDAALVECENGDVVCVFVGGNGLWASTESDPIRSYVCCSNDGGITWSQPEDITSQLWGSQASNTVCRSYKASFFGSGNGLRLTRGENAGRIMFAAAMCRKNANILDNFVVYSDDNGHTWHVSNKAYSGGDEAKLMELVDGRVLISVRQNGERGYNHSDDGGETWGTQGRWTSLRSNACNGDMLRVCSMDHGDSINILFHSIPNSLQREDVSIFTSRDEGETWQDPYLLFDGPSVYSSMTLLPDGCVGVLLEKNPSGQCEIWYQHIPVKLILQETPLQNH